MKKLWLPLLLSVFSIFSSCVTSLHPLVTYAKVIMDSRINGEWKTDKGDYSIYELYKSNLYRQNKEEIEKDLSKKDKNQQSINDSILSVRSYIIEYVRDGVRYNMFGSLIRLNGQLFMNFSPFTSRVEKIGAGVQVIDGDDDRFESLDPASSISTNTMAKIELVNNNTIKADFLDGNFIYEQVKAGRLKLKNERDDLYDTFMITASTSDLQQFLEKYGRDARLYDKENSVILTRKS